jgi:hypothetical protein
MAPENGTMGRTLAGLAWASMLLHRGPKTVLPCNIAATGRDRVRIGFPAAFAAAAELGPGDPAALQIFHPYVLTVPQDTFCLAVLLLQFSPLRS